MRIGEHMRPRALLVFAQPIWRSPCAQPHALGPHALAPDLMPDLVPDLCFEADLPKWVAHNLCGLGRMCPSARTPQPHSFICKSGRVCCVLKQFPSLRRPGSSTALLLANLCSLGCRGPLLFTKATASPTRGVAKASEAAPSDARGPSVLPQCDRRPPRWRGGHGCERDRPPPPPLPRRLLRRRGE